MSLEEINAALDEHQAVIVHFSHHALMREGVHFPDDLRGAVANAGQWELSCHVLTPGHSVEVVGSVGVVLELTHPMAVLRVRNSDAASGEAGGDGKPLTPESLVWSLTPAEDSFRYNEWRVQGSKVTGFFIHDPSNISVRVAHTEFGHVEVPVELPQMQQWLATIAPLPIYTMCDEGLVEL